MTLLATENTNTDEEKIKTPSKRAALTQRTTITKEEYLDSAKKAASVFLAAGAKANEVAKCLAARVLPVKSCDALLDKYLSEVQSVIKVARTMRRVVAKRGASYLDEKEVLQLAALAEERAALRAGKLRINRRVEEKNGE